VSTRRGCNGFATVVFSSHNVDRRCVGDSAHTLAPCWGMCLEVDLTREKAVYLLSPCSGEAEKPLKDFYSQTAHAPVWRKSVDCVPKITFLG